MLDLGIQRVRLLVRGLLNPASRRDRTVMEYVPEGRTNRRRVRWVDAVRGKGGKSTF